jgi:hypothetical protein
MGGGVLVKGGRKEFLSFWLFSGYPGFFLTVFFTFLYTIPCGLTMVVEY